MIEVKKKLKAELDKGKAMVDLWGNGDIFLNMIENSLDVEIFSLGNEITVSGDKKNVDLTCDLISELILQINEGHNLTQESISYTIESIKAGDKTLPHKFVSDVIMVGRGKIVKPKTTGQKKYVDAIRENTIIFAIGPAGTGKTYLAMAMAINALMNNEIGRIILVRPLVEAGEKLGFLPGDIYDKVDPYQRPLYDALHDMMEAEKFYSLMKTGIIEVAPLAYMRGRTINDSFIVLDEAQNTSADQMKMFLTRLGFGSKAVITGDITQIDLPYKSKSGLIVVQKILSGIKGIKFIYFSDRDIVRDKIVQDIVKAYDIYENSKKSKGSKK